MLREIKNALPLATALYARNLFLEVDYDLVKQTRRYKFAHEKDNKFQGTPNEDEVFTAEFCRSRYLEQSQEISTLYNESIRPIIEKELGKTFISHDIRCYKMDVGGHFRIHRDDYQSTYGFIWYLNQDWKWDWGGLLLILKEGLEADVYIPEFNKLVIMDHQLGQIPHAVTQVAEYANEPRLMIVGFLQ